MEGNFWQVSDHDAFLAFHAGLGCFNRKKTQTLSNWCIKTLAKCNLPSGGRTDCRWYLKHLSYDHHVGVCCYASGEVRPPQTMVRPLPPFGHELGHFNEVRSFGIFLRDRKMLSGPTCHLPEYLGWQISDLTFSHEMTLPAAVKQKSKVFVLTTRSSNAGPVGFCLWVEWKFFFVQAPFTYCKFCWKWD